MPFYVYILANNENNKYIVGFTNNLVKNIHQMKHSQEGIFASQQINKLVYFERHEHYDDAKRRERDVLNWDDIYTKQIVSLQNGKFEDLYAKIF
jgi:putative endonuclease